MCSCDMVAAGQSLFMSSVQDCMKVKTFPKRLIFIRLPCSGIQFMSSLCFERDDLLSMT